MPLFDKIFKRSAPISVDAPKKRDLAVQMRAGFGQGFGASRIDHTTASWESVPRNADYYLQELRRLVARSRQQTNNNDYAKAFIRICKQNIIGDQGIKLQARSCGLDGKLDVKANDAIEAEWDNWGLAENCDVKGQASWQEIQELLIGTTPTDGEHFLQIVEGPDAGPYGFGVLVIDAQRCPPEFNQQGLKDGHYIRGGIEYNRYGRPLFYYFSEEDHNGSYSLSTSNLRKVAAEDIVHSFVGDMVGQRRGIPWTATGLYRLRHLGGFEEAAVVNARVSANKMGFIEYAEGFGPELDEDDELHIQSEPGVIQELPEGASYKAGDHQFPSGEFAQFIKAELRGTAAGFGVPYEELAQDREHVNYSSIRQGTLDSREHWKMLQGWFIRRTVDKIFKRWLKYALLAQKIRIDGGKPLKAEQLRKYQAVVWQGRRWSWIDPKSEVDAAVASKNNLLTSPGQIIREQGKDPSMVWAEVAADIAAMRAAGIEEVYIQLAMGQKMNPLGPAPDKSGKAEA